MVDAVMENEAVETVQELSQLQQIEQEYNKIISLNFNVNVKDALTFDQASEFVGLFKDYKANMPEEMHKALTMFDTVRHMVTSDLQRKALNGRLREVSPGFMTQVDLVRNRIGRFPAHN